MCRKVAAMCGTRPSGGWIRSFLARNREIKLGKPTGLDISRGWAFCKPVIKHHFDLLAEIIREHQIPVENIYNMDEKGCQLGGGKKVSTYKSFVPCDRRMKYKKQSGNLELITIIECVCADGSNILPGFVFSGKEFSPKWFEVDPKIW